MTEFVTFLLPAAPLLVLLALLLFGRYPGREAIVRLSERIAAVHRDLLCASAPRSTAPRASSFVRHRGLFLASSLSGRAPPAAA